MELQYEEGQIPLDEDEKARLLKGNWKIRVAKVADIPITYGGKAIHNIMNTLPAVLATYLYREIKVDDIKDALETFVPSPTQTPGRLNFFKFKQFEFEIIWV